MNSIQAQPIQESIMNEIPNQLDIQPSFSQPVVEHMSTIQPMNYQPENQFDQSNLIQQPMNSVDLLNNIPSMDSIGTPVEPLFDNQSIESQKFLNNNLSTIQNFATSTSQPSPVESNEFDIFGQPINKN